MSINKPEELKVSGTRPGLIAFKLNCCEIDEERSIHLDAFNPDGFPYGHLGSKTAKRVVEWMDSAIQWLNDGANQEPEE